MECNLQEFVRRVSFLIPQIQRGVLKKGFKEITMGDIGFSQMIVLEFLKEKDGCKMKTVAESLSITTSAATGLVDRMVKSGLLKRVFYPKDRRIITVKMTKKGKGLIERIVKKRLELMAKIFGKLSKKERDIYLSILEKIQGIIKES